MTRKKKFRLGCLFLLVVFLLLCGLWIIVDKQRSPDPNRLLEHSPLACYIPADADIVLYLRDLDKMIDQGARSTALSRLYTHFAAPAVQRLDRRLPVISAGWLLRSLFGNECVVYIDKQGELGLVSRTRISAQTFLRVLMLLKPLIIPEYVDPSGAIVLPTKSSRYPRFWLRQTGSLVLAGSRLPTAGTAFYQAKTQPAKANPDIHICVRDHSRLLDIIAIRENHPFWPLVHLVIDRQISVINGHFSIQGLVLTLFSSSTATELQANAAKLEQYRNTLPTEIPFVCSYRGPDSLSVRDGRVWLGTQRLGRANARLDGLDILSPVHLFLKKQHSQPGVFVVFRSNEATELLSAQSLQKQTPPLYLSNCQEKLVLSNTAETIGICPSPFQAVDAMLPAPEHFYAFVDLLETYNLLKPYVMLAASTNTALAKPLSLLDQLSGAGARVRLYVYTSKRESLAELILN